MKTALQNRMCESVYDVRLFYRGKQMRKNLLSVIVPIYNTEKYLTKCLQSILRQTYDNIELILVDDGSKDRSGEICDEFSRKDSRVRVFHQENAGQQGAQTVGIEASTGEFISFVDSDDWIEPCMYEKLLCRMGNADLVTSGLRVENENGNLLGIIDDYFLSGKYETDSKLKFFFDNLIFIGSPDACGSLGGLSNNKVDKIFKSDIVKKMYNQVNIGIRLEEDYLFTILYTLQCKSVVVTHDIYYHYIKNPMSMTAKHDEHFLSSREKIFYAISSALRGHPYEESLLRQLQKRTFYYLVSNYASRSGFTDEPVFFNYVFPDYKRIVSKRVALFGAGKVGQSYNYWIKVQNIAEIVLWLDNKIPINTPQEIREPTTLLKMEYDCILIAVLKEDSAASIRSQLLALGVPQEKIFWEKPRNVLRDMVFNQKDS